MTTNLTERLGLLVKPFPSTPEAAVAYDSVTEIVERAVSHDWNVPVFQRLQLRVK